MNKFFIFFIFLVSCYNEPASIVITETTSKDSIAVRLYPTLISQIDSLKKQLLLKDTVSKKLLLKIDSLQNDVIKYQGNAVELKRTQQWLHKFISQNKELINENEIMRSQNEYVNQTNIDISDTIKNMRVQLYKATAEKEAYKKAASFKLSHVQFKAYGYKKYGWFKKAVIDTVSIASETKYLKVSFDVPANEKIESKTYILNICVKGVHGKGINKEYKVYFTGYELDNLLLTFEDRTEFEKGYHYVDITFENKSLYSSTLYLR